MGNTPDKIKKGIKDAAGAVKQAAEKGKVPRGTCHTTRLGTHILVPALPLMFPPYILIH